jgi:hypothetical protein
MARLLLATTTAVASTSSKARIVPRFRIVAEGLPDVGDFRGVLVRIGQILLNLLAHGFRVCLAPPLFACCGDDVPVAGFAEALFAAEMVDHQARAHARLGGDGADGGARESIPAEQFDGRVPDAGAGAEILSC